MAEQLLPLLQEADPESLDRVKRYIDKRQVRQIVRFFFGIRRHHFLTHGNFERGCTSMASLLTNDTKDCKDSRRRGNRWLQERVLRSTLWRTVVTVGAMFLRHAYIQYARSHQRRSSIALCITRDPATSASHDRPSCFPVTKSHSYG